MNDNIKGKVILETKRIGDQKLIYDIWQIIFYAILLATWAIGFVVSKVTHEDMTGLYLGIMILVLINLLSEKVRVWRSSRTSIIDLQLEPHDLNDLWAVLKRATEYLIDNDNTNELSASNIYVLMRWLIDNNENEDPDLKNWVKGLLDEMEDTWK